ncbi:MAG: hypothetical protein IOC52_04775 [Methylobacterium sp.]|nr:hypothetical protein [Methylobacterium sp.]
MKSFKVILTSVCLASLVVACVPKSGNDYLKTIASYGYIPLKSPVDDFVLGEKIHIATEEADGLKYITATYEVCTVGYSIIDKDQLTKNVAPSKTISISDVSVFDASANAKFDVNGLFNINISRLGYYKKVIVKIENAAFYELSADKADSLIITPACKASARKRSRQPNFQVVKLLRGDLVYEFETKPEVKVDTTFANKVGKELGNASAAVNVTGNNSFSVKGQNVVLALRAD